METKLLEYDNQYWKNDHEKFSMLYFLIKNHLRSWMTILNSKRNKEKYSNMVTWIEQQTPLLSSSEYNLKTKIYWILNNLHDFPMCSNTMNGVHRILHTNVIDLVKGYRHHKDSHGLYCCVECKNTDENYGKQITKSLLETFSDEKFKSDWLTRVTKTRHDKYGAFHNMKAMEEAFMKKYGVTCALLIPEVRQKTLDKWHEHYGENVDNPFQAEEVKEAIKKKLLEKTGYENSMQNPETKEKARQKLLDTYGTYSVSYKYVKDGLRFDSGYELCVYEFFSDIGFEIKYPSGLSIPYLDEFGKIHHYHPDLIIESVIVEVKGKHLMKDGTLINPFDKDDIHLQKLSEAKFKCMQEHNVFVISDVNIKPILNYICHKHNVDHYMKYCKQFTKEKT